MEQTASKSTTAPARAPASYASPIDPLFGRTPADAAVLAPDADAQAWIGVFQGDVHEDFPGFEGLFSHPALRPAPRLAKTRTDGSELARARQPATEPVPAL